MATALTNPRTEKDTSDSIKDCSICNEEYDEDKRCPRNLQCSHCLCTECITKLINRNKKQCPFCRRGFHAQSAKDLVKNTFSLELLKCIKDLEAENESLLKAIPKTCSDMVEIMKTNSKAMHKQNLAAFRIAEKQIEKRIQTIKKVKDTVMERQRKITGDLMNRINEMEEIYQIEVIYLEKENERLEKQWMEIQQKMYELHEVRAELNDATTIVQADSATDKVEASNTAVKTWIQDLKLGLSRGERTFEGLQKCVEATESKITDIMTLLTLTESENLEFNDQLAAMRLQKNIQGNITAQDLKKMDPQTEYVLKLRGIYAVHHHQGELRTGRISYSEGKLLIHCLKDLELPSNVYTVEHCELLKLVNPESRHAFLEFGIAGSILGRVFIELSPDSKRAQNFALFCSGERGISFEGTGILTVNKQNTLGAYVKCGIRNVGPELIPGTDVERDGVLMQPWLAGAVRGFSSTGKSGLFNILTRSEPNSFSHIAFGKVEAGLHVLTDAINKIPNISDVKIINCGLVLPL